MSPVLIGVLGAVFLIIVLAALTLMTLTPLIIVWSELHDHAAKPVSDAEGPSENGWELWVVWNLCTDWWIAVPAELSLDSDAVLAEWEDEREEDDAQGTAVFADMVNDLNLPVAGMAEPARALLARLPRAPIGDAHIVASSRNP